MGVGAPSTKNMIGVCLALSLGLGGAATARAQCNVINTTDLQGGPPAFIIKVFSGSPGQVSCATSTSSNVAFCGVVTAFAGNSGCPTGGANCRAVTAYVSAPGPSAHFCNFNCGACGTVVIDNTDGLPVELMEFSVEPSADVDSGEETPGASGEDPAKSEQAAPGRGEKG